MTHPSNPDDPILHYVFRAERDLGMIRRDVLGDGVLVALGLITCASAVLMWLFMEPLPVLAILFASGCAIVYMGLHGVRQSRRKLGKASVVASIDRAREFLDGEIVKDIGFGPGARVDVGVNYFIRGQWSPLYGIAFCKGGETIDVCPFYGYPMSTVDRLWPLTLAAMRRHGLALSAGFKAHLRYEKSRGGYWADVYDEFMADEVDDGRGFYDRYFAELREETARDERDGGS